MYKIKNFFCTTEPGWLAFYIIIGLILIGEALVIGFEFIAVVSIFAAAGTAVYGIGYGLYHLIKYLQTKCQADTDERDTSN